MSEHNCIWKYSKGPNKDLICGKRVYNDSKYCSKHIRNNQQPNDNKSTNSVKEDNELDTKTICTTVDPSISPVQDVEEDFKGSVKSEEDILLGKYFVYDCIRQFFHDHNEMNELLGNKSSKSSGSNIGSIIAMAGIGSLPIIIKNLMNSNIYDAIHKSEIFSTACNREGIYEEPTTVIKDSSEKGKFTIISENKEKDRTNIAPEGTDPITIRSVVI